MRERIAFITFIIRLESKIAPVERRHYDTISALTRDENLPEGLVLGDNALLVGIEVLEGDAGAAGDAEVRVVSEF
jgi:hypothetical protein